MTTHEIRNAINKFVYSLAKTYADSYVHMYVFPFIISLSPKTAQKLRDQRNDRTNVCAVTEVVVKIRNYFLTQPKAQI